MVGLLVIMRAVVSEVSLFLALLVLGRVCVAYFLGVSLWSVADSLLCGLLNEDAPG